MTEMDGETVDIDIIESSSNGPMRWKGLKIVETLKGKQNLPPIPSRKPTP